MILFVVPYFNSFKNFIKNKNQLNKGQNLVNESNNVKPEDKSQDSFLKENNTKHDDFINVKLNEMIIVFNIVNEEIKLKYLEKN